MEKSKRKMIIAISIGIGITVAVIVVALYLFISFMRGGYNSLMYKYLSKADNYESREAVYKGAFYFKSHNERIYIDETTDLDDAGHSIYLECSMYFGDNKEPTTMLFEVIKPNYKVLFQNNFFSDVSEGDEIKLRATIWVYLDNDFNFVADVQYANKHYLELEQGLKNIVKLMDENRM